MSILSDDDTGGMPIASLSVFKIVRTTSKPSRTTLECRRAAAYTETRKAGAPHASVERSPTHTRIMDMMEHDDSGPGLGCVVCTCVMHWDSAGMSVLAMSEKIGS